MRSLAHFLAMCGESHAHSLKETSPCKVVVVDHENIPPNEQSGMSRPPDIFNRLLKGTGWKVTAKQPDIFKIIREGTSSKGMRKQQKTFTGHRMLEDVLHILPNVHSDHGPNMRSS